MSNDNTPAGFGGVHIANVCGEIIAERCRQDERFGEQNHPDGTGLDFDDIRAEEARFGCELLAKSGALTWRAILREEVAEAFAESDPPKLREELLQVAAVAVAWVQAIDRHSIPWRYVVGVSL